MESNGIMSSEVRAYRRKPGRLEWHYMPNCRKYPEEGHIPSTPLDIVPQPMVCPICRRLQEQQNGILDTRKPSRNPNGFIRSLFG